MNGTKDIILQDFSKDINGHNPFLFFNKYK